MRGLRILLFSLVALMMVSCGTMKHIQYVEVPTVKTEYIAKTDTTIVRDSVFINRYMKADTVYQFKEKYRYVTKIKTDTLHTRDTVSVIKEVEVDKPYVPDYYRRVSWLFWILLSMVLGFTGWKIYRKVKKV